MKKYLFFFLVLFAFSSCDTIRQATNSTGTGFTLTGKWQLTGSTPDEALMGSVVQVTAIVSEGKLVSLQNNTQCYRENDIKWKEIKVQTNGGFTISNLLSNCNSGDLQYQPAQIEVVNMDEIRLTGKNVAGNDNVQTWKRVK